MSLIRLVLIMAVFTLAAPWGLAQDEIDFGDDSSPWVDDGECDDPRFEGEGMAGDLTDGNAYRDASDCRKLFGENKIRLAPFDGVVEQGELAEGDKQLTSEEFKDEYEFEGQAGKTIIVELRSTDFDPYLIVLDPSGEQFDNDDYKGEASMSRVELAIPEDGTYQVWASSFAPGETGSYRLTVRFIDTPEPGAPVPAADTQSGTLENGDATIESGEFADRYTYQGTQGQTINFDLHSIDFDPFVIVRTPSGEQFTNDDIEGDTARAMVTLELPESGTYEILVTSFAPGETGDYRLDIH